MRETIKILDNGNLIIKGHEYNKDDNSLIFTIRCLINEYDNLKLKYDKLVELHYKALKIGKKENNTYVMTYAVLADNINISKQPLTQVLCRAEFEKYRTVVTKPRRCRAFIVTKKSLQLLYEVLINKTKLTFSEQQFRELYKEIDNGYSC